MNEGSKETKSIAKEVKKWQVASILLGIAFMVSIFLGSYPSIYSFALQIALLLAGYRFLTLLRKVNEEKGL